MNKNRRLGTWRRRAPKLLSVVPEVPKHQAPKVRKLRVVQRVQRLPAVARAPKHQAQRVPKRLVRRAPKHQAQAEVQKLPAQRVPRCRDEEDYNHQGADKVPFDGDRLPSLCFCRYFLYYCTIRS